MLKHKRVLLTFGVTVFVIGFAAGNLVQFGSVAEAQSGQVFELRTYTANPGRLDALNTRFRDHTIDLFERHRMTNIGYWTPQDTPSSSNTLIYIIAHNSREAAQTNWQNFGNDPEWQRVSRESQLDGRILNNVESVFLDPTDFSPIQ